MLGQPVHYANMESGQRWVLLDIEGKPKYTWDSRGYRFRAVFDQLQRTVETFQQLNTDTEMLVERAVFGETLASPENSNSRMALVHFDDQAGVSATDLYDFKGNPVTGKRILAQDYKSTIDWLESVPLDNEEFKTTTSYDALNRAISIILPDGTIMRPKYNISGQIKQVEAMLAGEPGTTVFVSNIDYNARGQRTSITYRNGVSTTYEYDRLTNRLVHTITKRDPGAFPGDCPKPPLSGWPGCQIQNIFFTDDPMGNGTNIRDDAQQSIFFRNQRVDPTSSFIYDAIYRLIEASGREHLGLTGGLPNSPTPPGPYNRAQMGIAHPNDGKAMGVYTERYSYDRCGNILSMKHIGSQPIAPGWTRRYTYRETSLLEPTAFNNRLSSTDVGSTIHQYGYGEEAGRHGNITSMPHLSRMLWDSKDQLRLTSKQMVNNGGTPESTFYVYDSGGSRIRKVTERQSNLGVTPTRKSQIVYLGGFEIYREYESDGSKVRRERRTIHVTDGADRVALVETSIDNGSNDASETLIRYQLSSRLSSVKVELDGDARILSYEEYSPFGSTTYQGVSNETTSKKRYRYGGKERDEDTGFYYYGARYYLPWIGRWASCDPAGHSGGLNLFTYVNNNPIGISDPTGAQEARRFLPLDLTGNETEEDIHRMVREQGWDYNGTAIQLGPRRWRADIYPVGDPTGDGSSASAEGGTEESPSVSENTPDTEPAEEVPNSTPAEEASSAPPSPSSSGSSPQPTQERSWWSRGLGTAAAGALALGIGILLVSNPAGWFALASGALSIAAGGFGLGHGLAHLAVSGKTTAAMDEKMNEEASTVTSFIGSVGGLVGGSVGYLVTGTREGLDTGAFIGNLVEGAAVLGKGLVQMGRRELAYGRNGPNVSRHAGNLNKMATAHWKAASPRILRLYGHTRQTAFLRMRTNPIFTTGRERLVLSHVFSRASTKPWMHIFNRPWNVKLMWETEHVLVDPAAGQFIKQQFRPTPYTGWKRIYHLTPQWMHDAAFGSSRLAQGTANALTDD
ncbi:hypothetical protein FRC20_001326 [Serendipita sp. 405]|nr:hypothetical protein FRC20_001326 [Serendipita sp. 405]